MKILGRAITIVLAAGAAGCILLVSPPSGGEHCQFRGADTSCGVCLAKRCQSEIDALCINDPALVLPVVEQCAATSDDACTHIAPSSIATCLAERCPAYCYPKIGRSLTHCTEPFLSERLACVCEIGATTSDMECSSRTFTRTRCCAPAGWPGAALNCSCNAIACTPTSDGCVCTLTDNLSADSALECTGAHCCAIDDRCQCRARACGGAEREVATCNADALSCPKGTSAVAACSIRQ